MPEVKTTHKGLSNPDSAVKPVRVPVEPGVYMAMIMAAPNGVTKGTPPLMKISVEFQILYRDEDHDETQQGKRVVQDYILEDDPRQTDMSKQRLYELRMLLDATKTPYTDAGFNTDHLLTKTVKITVRHRSGKVDPADPTAPVPVFSNVVKVDTSEKVNESELV